MRKIISLVCVAFLLLIYVQASSGEYRIDIPCWSVGDWWEYSIKIETSSTKEDYVLKYMVSEIDKEYYIISISGYVNGSSSVMTWEGNVEGTQKIRRGNLAISEEIITVKGVAKMFFISGKYEYSTIKTYTPELEEYDFPFFSNDVWGINVRIHLKEKLNVSIAGIISTNRSSESDFSMIGESSYLGIERLSVPAGSYECAKVFFTDGENTSYWWYSEDVKNVIYYKSHSLSSKIDKKLLSYHLKQKEIKIDFSLMPEVCAAGQVVSIKGRADYRSAEVPVAQSPVKISMPELGITKNVRTDDDGKFFAEIIAPYAEDDTPTSYDIGSHGCIVFIEGAGSMTGEVIKTLTITDVPPPDINASMYSIQPERPVEGSEIKIRFYVENTGGSSADRSKYFVEMDGEIIEDGFIGVIPPGAREVVEINIMAEAGTHTIKCVFDSDNKIFESNEDNNEIIFNFTVDLMDIVPGKLEIEPKRPINEREIVSINFAYSIIGTANITSVSVSVLCGAISVFSKNISAKDKKIEGNATWRALPGNIKIRVIADPMGEITESNKSNNIMEREIFVNALPKSVINATYIGGRKYLFSAHDSHDFDGKIIAYLWSFGDNITSTLPSVEHEYERAGVYEVKLTVIDDGGASSHSYIHIIISNSPPSVVLPTIIEGYAGEKLHLTAYAIDADGDIVNYSWDADGDGKWDFHSPTNSSFYFVYNSTGYYRAIFRATDSYNSTVVSSVDIIIKEKEREISVNKTSEEKIEGNNMVAFLVIIVMILTGVNAYLVYENVRIRDMKYIEKVEDEIPPFPSEADIEHHEDAKKETVDDDKEASDEKIKKRKVVKKKKKKKSLE